MAWKNYSNVRRKKLRPGIQKMRKNWVKRVKVWAEGVERKKKERV